MEETAPAIFTVDGSPQGQALAVRSNSAELAALPSFRLQCQAGAVRRTDFRLGNRHRMRRFSASCRLNLGGQPVAIDSAQPVSQMAGICEIAFRIPASVAGDSVSLVD